MRGGRERRREAKSVCGALVVELLLALAMSDEEVVVLFDEAGVSVDAGVVEDEVAKYRRETGDQHEIYLDWSDR
jgi:hypothetical protein